MDSKPVDGIFKRFPVVIGRHLKLLLSENIKMPVGELLSPRNMTLERYCYIWT
jgi:hypothetical protein